ncbi:AbrB/MazE/SpoVT family DNA-binding domain-containing protein [Gracilibacillus sp. YIM 98692]|uniref:AbrB/MazE/SpoVT family DNA-binding domain-containing protein n=1 Tax=Gracilibacillus sp. YIM 98692 TaxID=2663532 RepID=UPI0013D09E99|nr:AbrB/MazE/SpoVT family DNA-binding domain-containing protein [Gracilibacillus sp. YIM 98692]
MKKIKVVSVGDGLGIQLPQEIIEKLSVKAGSYLYLNETHNEINISMKKKPTLEELLERVTEENQHDPVDWD